MSCHLGKRVKSVEDLLLFFFQAGSTSPKTTRESVAGGASSDCLWPSQTLLLVFEAILSAYLLIEVAEILCAITLGFQDTQSHHQFFVVTHELCAKNRNILLWKNKCVHSRVTCQLNRSQTNVVQLLFVSSSPKVFSSRGPKEKGYLCEEQWWTSDPSFHNFSPQSWTPPTIRPTGLSNFGPEEAFVNNISFYQTRKWTMNSPLWQTNCWFCNQGRTNSLFYYLGLNQEDLCLFWAQCLLFGAADSLICDLVVVKKSCVALHGLFCVVQFSWTQTESPNQTSGAHLQLALCPQWSHQSRKRESGRVGWLWCWTFPQTLAVKSNTCKIWGSTYRAVNLVWLLLRPHAFFHTDKFSCWVQNWFRIRNHECEQIDLKFWSGTSCLVFTGIPSLAFPAMRHSR